MLYLLFAFAIGCAIPMQAAINNQLKPYLDESTLMASLVSRGMVGPAVREITLTRAMGALLVVAGVLLVNFDQLK